MAITEEGIEGEKIARIILKKYGFQLFGGDWIIKSNLGKYYLVEIKHKLECFKSPPFDGHGLDLFKIVAREQFRKDTGIKTILLIVDKEQKRVYWNFLDSLEKGDYFKTKNNIIIYPLDNFLPEEEFVKLNEEQSNGIY